MGTDLEAAGCKVIQVDEPALREAMPLRESAKDEYLTWTVDSFKLATSGSASSVQIHTHMCYCEFEDCMDAIDRMDTDVNSIENKIQSFLDAGVSKENLVINPDCGLKTRNWPE